MYAVIQTGGKQYKVQPGDIVEVEKLSGDVGSSIQFDQVLFVSQPAPAAKEGEQTAPSQIWLGKPTLSGAKVQGEVVGQGRGEKLLVFKMKRRKQYRKTQGHRQELTHVLITHVDTGAGSKAEIETSQKTKILSTFHTSLKPKGLAFTPKTLGSRERARRALAEKLGKTA